MKLFYLTLCLILMTPIYCAAQQSKADSFEAAKQKIEEIEISFYPNPFQRIITFEKDPIHKVDIIEIFHINGEQLATLQANLGDKFSLDLSHAPTGQYIFRAIGPDGLLQTGQFFKN